MSRRRLLLLLLLPLLLVGIAASCALVRMPGPRHTGPLPALAKDEEGVAARLSQDITQLAVAIGERNFARPEALLAASDWVRAELAATGLAVETQTFTVEAAGGQTFFNHAVEIRGRERPDEIVVIGAHYDTAIGTPGANDNASGVAVLLALVRGFAPEKQPFARTVRFVAFANEEPPFFGTPDMGSARAARRSKGRGEEIVAMLSLETLGCYSDVEGSQRYPFPFALLYPATGDFVGFVGDTSSLALAHQAVASFRTHAAFPSEGAALPGAIPGVDWSDHASYWAIGTPALMVTDTAPFRFEHYHEATDTPDKVDVERLARVTTGLRGVVVDLARD